MKKGKDTEKNQGEKRMLYVTGDIHGDINRFHTPQMKKLKKTDTLIICGDFGFTWETDSKEQKKLKWIGNRRYTTLFVEGSHENFKTLETFPEVEMYGGKVRQLGKRLFQLMRGEVYEIEGQKVFAFGGGDLDDDEEHVEGVNWLVGEEPSQQDMENALENLNRLNWEVDYIVSHDILSKIKGFMVMEDDRYTQMHTFFDEIGERVQYKHWYFGHYHVDRVISSAMTAVYQKVVPVTDGKNYSL